MAENIFQKIQAARTVAGIPARGRRAQEWYRQNIQALLDGRPIRGREQLIEAEGAELRTPNEVQRQGSMYMFVYDPKLKKKLPVYDRFPMVFVLEMRRDSFLGLNLHYLSPQWRAKLFNELSILLSNQNMTENTRLRLSYQVIKDVSKFNDALPLIREYKHNYIRSRLLWVHPRDWEIALFLPAARFQKQGMQSTWSATRQVIREQRRAKRKAAKIRRQREQEKRRLEQIRDTAQE